ncbi:hypothetical protein ACIREM_37400 [Streptomyces shenzhenensis]|uniref:hypothetical protein n=1 Tax=Streptomyces shenzhenensis TaxID=943815 RepID=UPI00380E8BF3
MPAPRWRPRPPGRPGAAQGPPRHAATPPTGDGHPAVAEPAIAALTIGTAAPALAGDNRPTDAPADITPQGDTYGTGTPADVAPQSDKQGTGTPTDTTPQGDNHGIGAPADLTPQGDDASGRRAPGR